MGLLCHFLNQFLDWSGIRQGLPGQKWMDLVGMNTMGLVQIGKHHVIMLAYTGLVRLVLEKVACTSGPHENTPCMNDQWGNPIGKGVI